MNAAERTVIIYQRLQNTFSPAELKVQDDSAQHIGHAGSQSGAGHYTVIISAECFKGQPAVAVHRAIYQALHDLIPKEIHALRIRYLNAF
jgi:BolA protein